MSGPEFGLVMRPLWVKCQSLFSRLTPNILNHLCQVRVSTSKGKAVTGTQSQSSKHLKQPEITKYAWSFLEARPRGGGAGVRLHKDPALCDAPCWPETTGHFNVSDGRAAHPPGTLSAKHTVFCDSNGFQALLPFHSHKYLFF